MDIASQFAEGRLFCAVFTSSSGVRAFADAHPGIDFSCVRAACIGEKTRDTAADLGMSTWVSGEATMDSLCELIASEFAKRPQASSAQVS